MISNANQFRRLDAMQLKNGKTNTYQSIGGSSLCTFNHICNKTIPEQE